MGLLGCQGEEFIHNVENWGDPKGDEGEELLHQAGRRNMAAESRTAWNDKKEK